MEFKILVREEVQLCGLRIELTRSQQSNFHVIRKHWQRFNALLRQDNISLGHNWVKYGLTIKENEKYYYVAAIPFKQSNELFENYKVEHDDYAHFKHVGNMSALKTTIYSIYKKVLPNSGLKVDANRTLIHFELYDSMFKWNQSDSIINLYVPVLK